MRPFEVLRSYEPITKRSVHRSFHEHGEDPHRWLSGDAILSLYDLLVTLVQQRQSRHLPPLAFAQLSHKHAEQPVPQNGEASCLLVFDAVDTQLVCPSIKQFLRSAVSGEEEEAAEDDDDDDDVEILSSELLEHRVALQHKLVHLMRSRQSFAIVGPLNVIAHWVLMTVSVRFDDGAAAAPTVFIYLDDPQSYNRSQLTCGDFRGDQKMFRYLSRSVRAFIRRWARYDGDATVYADVIAHGLQEDDNASDCGVHCVNMMLSTTVLHAYRASRPVRYGNGDISDRDRAYHNSATIGHAEAQIPAELLRYTLALFAHYFETNTTDPSSTAVTSWCYYTEDGSASNQIQDLLLSAVSQFIDDTVINTLLMTELARTKRHTSTDYQRLKEYVKRQYFLTNSPTKPDWQTFKIVWNVHVDYDRLYYGDCLLPSKHLNHKQTLDRCLQLDKDIPARVIKFVLNHCPCKDIH